MYRHYVPKRAPLSFWMLDDTVPFQEYSGTGTAGDKKAGSADPTKSAPLVSGAAYSSVFKAGSIGQFAQNVFKQGLERRPFALEAWAYPVCKTTGNLPQTYRENLITNPSFEVDLAGWNVTAGRTMTRTADTSTGAGSFSAYTTFSAINEYVRTGQGQTPVKPNTQYSARASVRMVTGPATLFNIKIEWWSAIGSGYLGSTTSSNVSITASTTSISVTGTSPANAVAANVSITQAAANTGLTMAVDSVSLVEGQPAYFDGAMPGYEWAGTAHNSISRTLTNVSRVNYALDPEATGSPAGNIANIGPGQYSASSDTSQSVSGGQSWKMVATGVASIGAKFMTYPSTAIVSGDTIMWSIMLRSDVAITVSPYWERNSPYTGGGGGSAVNVPANTWTKVTGSVTFTGSQSGNSGYGFGFLQSGNAAIGNTIWMDQGLIEKNVSSLGTYFGGSSVGAVWSGTTNASPSYLLISNSPQQVLSHNNSFDGLTINGSVVQFGTSYLTSGNAFCDYDLGTLRAAHVVGIHNADQNQLWVNGEMVSSVDITDAQKADSYFAAADGSLYSGYTVSSQEVAMNGVAMYASISGDDIAKNYAAGIDTIGQARVTPQLGGLTMNLDAATGAVFLSESWKDKSDFELGVKTNVEIAPDQIEPAYVGGVSVPGSWKIAMPLDAQGDTSIYGVMVEWSGYNVTVDVTLNGTWTPAKNGELISIIPNGYNPTGKDLQIRVNFAGGLASDPAYLESLSVVGFRNNSVNSLANRTITASYPAVMRGDYEPTMYREDNGVNLHGGTLTIGADSSADPEVARTLELWIKPLSGTPTISVTGTTYRNGAVDSTLPIGEWSLLHIVAAADITSAITITGDCIVGQATTYPTALSASDVDFIFDSYVGAAVIRFTESATMTISEGATPTTIYANDWGIDSAG